MIFGFLKNQSLKYTFYLRIGIPWKKNHSTKLWLRVIFYL
ncbi:hypothetical protein C943_01097 [Mariniradius saccharolyticus AK6]|uniref:Uncharacterized protein n=1 Tax=Mariniradius saccharolyticus AK6 TaxID=1239962 RepID=M7X4L9_9BACT|nr:hypothetical protein C943_01097 [Mariniradius saccharolyticus AK6]